MEHHAHTSLLERFLGKMDDKQRRKIQDKIVHKLLPCIAWVLFCLGIALVVTDAMLGNVWSWISATVGLF